MADGSAHPNIDTAAALAFLREIAPGQPVTFQTFDDSRDARGQFVRVIHAPAGEIPEELAALNARGAGVFFTVNATDGNGREAKNITEVRAFFVDFDTVDTDRPAMLAAMPVPPSAIIESSPGKHHAYWYVTDCPLEQFKQAQKTLAAAFQTDPKVCDLPRVMRLPGFLHRKGQPFLVRRVGGDGRCLNSAEIAALFATLPKPAQTPPASAQESPPRHAPPEGDRYAMRALQNALGAVMTAQEGQRNDTLNREAFGLYGLVKAGRLDAATVADSLTRTAQSIGLSSGEITATLASAENSATPRHEGLAEERTPAADIWRLHDGTATAGAPLAPLNSAQWAEVISLENLESAEPSVFLTEEILPVGTTTLLAAHGGTGKSMLALQWAVCIALGRSFFGKATTAGRVVFFSAEDSGQHVRHRLRKICFAYGVSPAALADRLLLLDATNIDASLYAEMQNPITRARVCRTTACYDQLRECVETFKADALIIDNASDTFAGNENARFDVRGFIRSLNSLAANLATAVLLISHVDKNTAKNSRDNGEGYSGSTAWHNSARSRLFLSAKDGGLLLEHRKANHGTLAQPLMLQWCGGVITAGETPQEGADSAAIAALLRQGDEKAVLRLIWEFTERGESVATAVNSPNNARKLLGGQPTYPKGMKHGGDIYDLLRDSQRAGRIEAESYPTPDRKARTRWRVTASGMEWAGIAPSAPSAPSPVDGADTTDGAS